MESVHDMATVMEHHEVIVPPAQQVIVPHTVIAETAMHVLSVALVVAGHKEPPEVSGQVESAVENLHLVTGMVVQSVLTALHMEIAHNGENVLPMVSVAPVQNVPNVLALVIVLSEASVPHMEIVVLAQIVAGSEHPTETVEIDHVSATAEVVPTVLVHHEVVAMTVLLAGRSQNLQKNSAWHVSCVWFVLIMMTHGLMTMSPVTSSTRWLVMS